MSGGPLLGYNKSFDLHKLRYPLLGSFKLDGWRAQWWGIEFMSRTLNTIPNRFLQTLGKRYLGDAGAYFDGEIIVGEPTAPGCFNKTDSFCKRIAGVPEERVRFFVFDLAAYEETPYEARIKRLFGNEFVTLLEQRLLKDPEAVLTMYDEAVSCNYEGLILRDPKGRYKHGRSGLREQLMLKLKPIEHVECKILGVEELLHNANPAERDARGYLKRSSHRAGLIPSGTLGAIIVDWQGEELRVGTFKGIDKRTLQEWWNNRDRLPGQYARIDYLSYGMKDLPRSARCSGLRSEFSLK